VPHGVVAYWKFDESAGQLAKAAAGGADGTVHEASWTQGYAGGALRFSGPKSHVDIPDRPVLNPSGPFEISLWAYIEERPQGFATLIEKGSGYGGSFRVLLLRSGNIRAAIGNEHLTVDSSIAPSLHQWHQIDMIFTGRELQLKMDGQQTARREVAKPTLKSTYEVVIGRGFVGKIDDVKIVNRE
jgi:hypothetical protein